MFKLNLLLLTFVLAFAVGCKKEEKSEATEAPAATEWPANTDDSSELEAAPTDEMPAGEATETTEADE
jgi:hypothetical protein